MLQSNTVSHWLGANLESALINIARAADLPSSSAAPPPAAPPPPPAATAPPDGTEASFSRPGMKYKVIKHEMFQMLMQPITPDLLSD